MIYVTSTPSRPNGDQVSVKGTYSTSTGAYKRKEISSQASSISLVKMEKVRGRSRKSKEV